jgi:AmmeMemoRadiSam system protein B
MKSESEPAGKKKKSGPTGPPKIGPDDPVPSLRTVTAEARPMDGEAATGDEPPVRIVLRDPEGFASEPIVLTPETLALVSIFDGKRTLKQVLQVFEERYDIRLREDNILQLIAKLDETGYLDSPRFRERLREQVVAYLRAPTRPTAHAGTAYPEDAAGVRKMAEGFFLAADGPGHLPSIRSPKEHQLSGLILPHIDLRVGGATYAHGYKALLERSQADLFVILGVAHQGAGDGLYHLSTKDFETPLGTVKVERNIATRLQSVSETDPSLGEYLHRNEHSIEFQTVLMQTMIKDRARRNFEIVPVLCGPVEPFLPSDEKEGSDPRDDARFKRFVETLREELDKSKRKWCIIASVDFSHVGPKFGDMTSMTQRLLLPVARGDRRLLEPLERVDADAFCKEVFRTRNSRHVDAVMATLTLLSVGKGIFAKGQLLHYDQMFEDPTKSVVSFAAMALESK